MFAQLTILGVILAYVALAAFLAFRLAKALSIWRPAPRPGERRNKDSSLPRNDHQSLASRDKQNALLSNDATKMTLTEKISGGIPKHPLACFGACGSAVAAVSFPEAGNGLPGVSQPIGLQVMTSSLGHFIRPSSAGSLRLGASLPPFLKRAMIIRAIQR